MTRVALFGKMAAGKTTIAAALAEMGYRKVAFADPLKKVAAMAYGTIDKGYDYEITTEEGKRGFKTGRQILQEVGQTLKTVDRDFWLAIFLKEVMNDTKVVVDDGRFMFEMEALRDEGFLIVYVNAPDAVREQRYEYLYGRKPKKEEMSHPSEQELEKIAFHSDIAVQGTEDSYWNVKKILEKMNGKSTSSITS